jgi:hypothetical protein
MSLQLIMEILTTPMVPWPANSATVPPLEVTWPTMRSPAQLLPLFATRKTELRSSQVMLSAVAQAQLLVPVAGISLVLGQWKVMGMLIMVT